jgi:mannitol/fructose-specific phosphotransferase system IIA component (Ntr-type)
MKLSSLLTPERVLINVKEKDKDAVLNFLVNKIGQLGNIENIDDLRKEVMDREALGNTGIGRGIGFPHAKSSHVGSLQLLLALPAKPLEYGSLDGVPVSIILFIVAPADGDNNEYLHTMARISRLLGKNNVREQILKAKSPEEIIDIVADNEA